MNVDLERFAAELRAAIDVHGLTSGLDTQQVVTASRRKRKARLVAVTTVTVLGLATGVTGVVAMAGQGDPATVATHEATPTPSPTAGPAQGPGPIDASWAENARTGAASEEQIATLDDGELTFDEYESSVDRAVACIREAGIEVNGPWFPQTAGIAFPVISYSYESTSPGRTSAETQAIADDCLATHSFYVEGAYQTAPAVLQAADARFEPYRADIIACVRANGGEVAADAHREQVLLAASNVESNSHIDCVRESGFR